MTGKGKPEAGDRTVTDGLGDKQSPDETIGQANAVKEEYDQQIAVLFQDMRRSSGRTIDSLAEHLETSPDILEALEKGDLDSLPAWEQSSKVIGNYATLLGISPEPILRRLALNIQARNKKVAQQGSEGVSQKKTEIQVMSPSNEAVDKSESPVTVMPAKQPIYRPVDLSSQQTRETASAPVRQTSVAERQVSKVTQAAPLSIDKEAVLPIEEQTRLLVEETVVAHEFGGQRIEPTFSAAKGDVPPKTSTSDGVQTGNSDGATSALNVQPEPLRADRHENFTEDRMGAGLGMPGFGEETRKGIGLLTWLGLLVILLAGVYIAWSFSSQPRLGELLLDNSSDSFHPTKK